MNDNLKHKAEEALGKAKGKLGEKTDDPELQAEGQVDESEAQLKQAADKAKEAFGR